MLAAGRLPGQPGIIRIGKDIRVDLFEAVSARSWEFYNGQASGALAVRIAAVAGAAATVMRTVAWNLVPPVIDLVGSVVLASIGWRIGGTLVIVAGAATFVLHRLGLRGFPVRHAYHHEAAEVAGAVADVLANMGIVGPSGAGKSTLLRLVQGIVAPERGEVLLGGEALASRARDSLAQAFCVVTQEVSLFQRSVRDTCATAAPRRHGTRCWRCPGRSAATSSSPTCPGDAARLWASPVPSAIEWGRRREACWRDTASNRAGNLKYKVVRRRCCACRVVCLTSNATLSRKLGRSPKPGHHIN